MGESATQFWRALEDLHLWEQQHLPGMGLPQGREVLFWLLKSRAQPRPLKDLYQSSRFSEPTIRSCLKIFADSGLIVIECSGRDMRARVARMTPKLEEAMATYRQLLLQIAAPGDPEQNLNLPDQASIELRQFASPSRTIFEGDSGRTN